MDEFPRTMVGGVSLPRLIVGTNWFLGYSHTSKAKDTFIKNYQSRDHLRDVLTVYLERGIDAVMAPVSTFLEEAIQDAEERTGRKMIRILTPHFKIRPDDPPESEPEKVIDECRRLGATFVMPHQAITDALVDRRDHTIRDLGQFTRLIRERGMIPGLSTHMPESVIYADKMGADVETYIQIL